MVEEREAEVIQVQPREQVVVAAAVEDLMLQEEQETLHHILQSKVKLVGLEVFRKVRAAVEAVPEEREVTCLHLPLLADTEVQEYKFLYLDHQRLHNQQELLDHLELDGLLAAAVVAL